MIQPNLTYALSTKNKLPYLKRAVDELLAHKTPDVEVVIIDGGSTDGTVEYLAALHAAGKVDVFVSEPDCGEAHGSNKALLAARGTLIKMITDDDAIHYPSWTRAKEFMLAHPEIDCIGTDGIKSRNSARYPISSMLHRDRFERRLRNATPFAFCGIGLMIRKSSLPLLGLFDTNFARVDAEYTLRITASKARMAWFTLETYSHIRNTQSQSVKQERRITEEMERLEMLYFGGSISLNLKRRIRGYVRRVLSTPGSPASTPSENGDQESEWNRLYDSSMEWLNKNAASNKGEFLS